MIEEIKSDKAFREERRNEFLFRSPAIDDTDLKATLVAVERLTGENTVWAY